MSIFYGRFKADHRFAAENMSAYIDGRLSAHEAARLERHLTLCETCPADLATLRQTKSLLQRAPVLAVPRSFALPANAQVQRVRYQRLNRSFAMLGSASAVVALLLVVLIAGDTLFSFLGIPANTATYVAAPLGSRSASSAGAVDTRPALVATSEGVAESAYTPTEQPAATGTTQDHVIPPSASSQPSEAAVGKLAAVPQSTPSPDESRSATIEAAAVDTVTPPAPRGLGVERNSSATPSVTPLAPSATPISPSPTATQLEATATPVTPSPTATRPEATTTPAEVAAVAATNAQGEAATPAPADDSWTQQPLWRAWRGVRIAAFMLAGLLCILLAGLLWTGYRRRH